MEVALKRQTKEGDGGYNYGSTRPSINTIIFISDIDLELNEHIICICVFLFTQCLIGQILRKG